MYVLVFLLSIHYFVTSSALDLPRCPYPLVEDIKPCICTVDEQYRMLLTCDFEADFTEESFQRVTDAFDYNNEIYSLKIDLYSYYNSNYKFYPELNITNLGKLNITNFSLKSANLQNRLFGEGAFAGSVGSIKNINVEDVGVLTNTSIDLGSHVLHQACPTLRSLKLECVSQLSSTTLTTSPNLQEVSLKRSTFPILPSSLFTTENVPNIQSIDVGVLYDLNLQTDAFRDLQSLTNLEISATKIDIIQSYAFNNLPNLKSLQMKDINIVRIEEDAFKNLTSLEAFEISSSDITELPRIFSNSPSLKTFSLTNSELARVDDNAFDGVPALEELTMSSNTELLELKLTSMKNLTEVSLTRCSKLNSVNISDMPKLTQLELTYTTSLSLVSLDTLPSLRSLNIRQDNKKSMLSMDISNCQNLSTLYVSSNNLVSLALHNVDALSDLDLENNQNLNHTGLGTSLHSIVHSDATISLRSTHVMNLDEFVFRPLLETFTSVESSSGYVDIYNVALDCGCDVKWIIQDFHFQTKFFQSARCDDGSSLADVDPILLDVMCPP